MPVSRPASLRGIGLALHRWIALALCVLILPVAVSGALLVWKDELDALIHPARYAVTGGELLAASRYVTSAQTSLASGFRPVAVRFPADASRPVIVLARGQRMADRPPPLFFVYLDPPTARVLEVVDFRASLFGFLHRFHENLTVPEYSGRAAVGWIGVGLLALALTGLWMWWPRSGAVSSGLRW